LAIAKAATFCTHNAEVEGSSPSLTTTSFNDLALPVLARRWEMRDLCGKSKRLHEDALRFSQGSGARLLTRTDPLLASETLAAVLAVNFVCAFGAWSCVAVAGPSGRLSREPEVR
jgi:hypothetical protein